MAAQPVPARTPSRPSIVTAAGLAVVLAAAAVLSFDALRSLAEAVSIPAGLAWLLPIAVDAGAAVSCATWLSPRSPADASRFAARMTWCLLAVTVAGNAGQLGMHAEHLVPPWWVAVLVGAIAPAVVGSSVHLLVLLGRTPVPAGPDREADHEDAPQLDEHGLSLLWRDAPPAGPLDPDPLTADPDPGPDPDDRHLIEQLTAWAERERAVPSRERIRVEYGIGTRRAARIRDTVLTTHDLQETTP